MAQTFKGEGWLCRDCGQAVVRTFQSRTLLQGWWGLVAAFMNLGSIIGNTKALVVLGRLDRPLEPGGLDPGRPVFARSGMLIIPIFAAIVCVILVASELDHSAPLEVGSCVQAGSGDSVSGVECSADNEGELVSKVSDPIACEPWTEWYVEVTGAGAQASADLDYYCVDNHIYPDSWDPDLADLSDFVEQAWGGHFDHPVEVIYQTRDEFIARIESDAQEYADVVGTAGGPDPSAIEDVPLSEDGPDLWLGELRALGYVVGEPDLSGQSSLVETEPVEAEFDVATEQIYVRDDLPAEYLRLTLAHELAHALQHQTFGLNRVYDTDEQWSSWQMLVEGDARDIENRYHATLSASEVAAVEEYLGEEPFDYSSVEPFLALDAAAPYELGAATLYLTRTLGGNEAVHELYERADLTTDQMLNPAALMTESGREETPDPEVPDDEEVVWQSDFGALALWEMLAGRVPDVLAREAVDTWHGGTLVDTLDADGNVCVNIRFTTDDDDGRDVLQAALEQWASRHGDNATLTPVATDNVDLRSCDPGPEGPPSDLGDVIDAFWVPTTEAYALAAVLEPGADAETVACTRAALRATLTTEELRGIDAPPDERSTDFADAAADC